MSKNVWDATLYRKQSNKINMLLKINTIQNDCQTIWRTRRQSCLSSVPRPSIIVVNVHEFLRVGSSALEQARGSVPRRVHQNVNIASIQKIFTTVQSPIRNLHEDNFVV